ncbi:hypothetical protein POM88_025534 [Heracleum sosnowskyi]|uniref:Uncharacterized protein n=1 Tax=Heracleum sosnowskyi TaxID=360622 RepID=A0AAD8I767_9APIA|nr:hypothetical protein POM88_025534 [Heracleum sosnowskyi]
MLSYVFVAKSSHTTSFGALSAIGPSPAMNSGILTWSDGPDKKTTDALTSCRTDRAGLVNAAPWFYIPYPFQWGAPTFTTGEAFAMIVSSFVASIESTGTYIATARYGSATPVPPSIMSRGIGDRLLLIIQGSLLCPFRTDGTACLYYKTSSLQAT